MQNNSKQKKKLIIDFNHISNRLSNEEIDELKLITCHITKRCGCTKVHTKD